MKFRFLLNIKDANKKSTEASNTVERKSEIDKLYLYFIAHVRLYL